MVTRWVVAEMALFDAREDHLEVNLGVGVAGGEGGAGMAPEDEGRGGVDGEERGDDGDAVEIEATGVGAVPGWV